MRVHYMWESINIYITHYMDEGTNLNNLNSLSISCLRKIHQNTCQNLKTTNPPQHTYLQPTSLFKIFLVMGIFVCPCITLCHTLNLKYITILNTCINSCFARTCFRCWVELIPPQCLLDYRLWSTPDNE